MIAAKVDTRANANRPLRRLERAGKLLRLSVRNAVAFQIAPGAHDGTEPVFHLRDDEAAELLVGELLRAEHGDGDQRICRPARKTERPG